MCHLSDNTGRDVMFSTLWIIVFRIINIFKKNLMEIYFMWLNSLELSVYWKNNIFILKNWN